jgi:hypothetical protein
MADRITAGKKAGRFFAYKDGCMDAGTVLYASVYSKNSYGCGRRRTGSYGYIAPADYRYFTGRIEDTHVEAAEGGYEINLFSRQSCGGGPKWTREILVRVTASGSVEQWSSATVYEDIADTVCVD